MMPKKGVVVPMGAAGEMDDARAYGQSCLQKENLFYLYYTAGHGSNYRTALGISKDGLNFVKKGVVLPLGSAGEIGGWLTGYPYALYVDNYFWLYHIASYPDTQFAKHVALALSKDGINFVKKGSVLTIGSAGDFDDGRVISSAALYKDGYFWLYYGGDESETGTAIRIGLALSKDGFNFVKKGVVVPLGATGDSDDYHIYPFAAFYKDNYFWLYYNASDGAANRSALAISKDGINFVKKGIVLPLGGSGEVDEGNAYQPFVMPNGPYFSMYYSAVDVTGTTWRTCLANSKDGINFG
jgi:predicted GH43/DUF377 family glycosyl hydrolase